LRELIDVLNTKQYNKERIVVIKKVCQGDYHNINVFMLYRIGK